MSLSVASPGAANLWTPSTLLVVFFLNLLARGDGYFPFPKSVDPNLFGSVVLFQTLVLIVASVWMAVLVVRSAGLGPVVAMGERAQVVLAACSVALIAALQVLNGWRFAEFGYTSKPVLLGVLLVAASIALAALWAHSRFAGILLAGLILKLYPIVCFPAAAKRSDMLPIIENAAQSLVVGDNIYRYYLLDNGVWTQMVRFPGLVVTYAPAVILRFDARLITLACETLFFVLLFRRFGRNPLFLTGLILLALSPYWHFRHELYEAPFWVALVVLLLAIERRDRAVEIVTLSVLVCMHQWSVLFLPFIVLLWARSRSWRYGLATAGSALAVGALVVGVASRGDFASFWQHTVAYYSAALTLWVEQGGFPPGSLFLTPSIASVGGVAAVRVASLAFVAAVFVWAIARLRTSAQLPGFLAIALAALLVTNTVAWTYQYLLVGALLWIGFMLRAEPGSEVAEVS
jgi:hypothetical protein